MARALREEGLEALEPLRPVVRDHRLWRRGPHPRRQRSLQFGSGPTLTRTVERSISHDRFKVLAPVLVQRRQDPAVSLDFAILQRPQ